MDWIEVKVHTTTAGADLVSEQLMQEGATGTMVEDRADVPDPDKPTGYWEMIDPDLIQHMPEDVVVHAWFEPDHRYADRMQALRDRFEQWQRMELGMDLVTGGTDNHLMLTDLRSLGVTGKELQNRLDEVHITVNKNAIPNDPQKPNVTSGVRIGTPAATTRGMVEEDMRVIGQCIYRAATDFEKSADDIRAQVAALTEKYPLYE